MPTTSKFEPEYKEILNAQGKKFLKKVGETNVYEKIQAGKDSATLENLINKYKIKINDENLTKLDETITDLTNIPTNLVEALNTIDEARATYENSPTEIKKVFNNNFTEFLAGSQNGTLESLIKQYKPQQQEETVTAEKTLEEQLADAKAELKTLKEANNE
jgi:hypothetical protein